MSPEALDEAKTYTAKLDVFSFGVIVIQILTRQFPNPTDRFRLVYSSEFDDTLRQVVPETERREAHLKLIPDTHSLKPIALQCLQKKENERPSAVQLSERLTELKQSSQYRESMHQTQSSSDIQQLQQQLQGQRILTEDKTREVQEHQIRTTELESMVEDKNRQLQAKEKQLHEKEEILRASEQLVAELQQRLQQKGDISKMTGGMGRMRHRKCIEEQQWYMGTQPTSDQLTQTGSTRTRICLVKNSGLSYLTTPTKVLVWQLLMVFSLVWAVSMMATPTLSSVSQEVRGSSGLRSSLLCPHHASQQLVSLQGRL